MACWCNDQCPNVTQARKFVAEKQFHKAEIELRRVLVRAPMCTQANIMLAHGLTISNRASFAAIHLERAVRNGMTPDLALRVAANLRQQARLADSVQAYRLAVELAPNAPGAHAGLIGALEAAGELDEAMTAITAAAEKFSFKGDLRRVAALVFAAREDHEDALAILRADDLTPLELLDRGRIYDTLGEHDSAWADWSLAKNRLAREQGHVYQRRQMERRASNLIEAAEPARLRYLPEAETVFGDPQPLFITGFPRSGTTMIEAALSSHSRIRAGDELMFLGEVIRLLSPLLRAGVPYPAAMMAFASAENSVMPSLMRDYYLRKAQERVRFGADTLFFSDKMPLNELHLPLIYCLFPAAPVFHVRRHPLDIVVSNFSHYLVHGGFYASSIEACALHLTLADKVLEHYKRHVIARTKRHFREVRYETFVGNVAREIDSMISGIGLTPEPACREPHRNPWHSRTISYRQIKRPIYTTSVERFRPYMHHLAPIIETLRPIIEREGYEL